MKQKQNKTTMADINSAVARVKGKINMINSQLLKDALTKMLDFTEALNSDCDLDAALRMIKDIEAHVDDVLTKQKQTIIKNGKASTTKSDVVLINEIDFAPARKQLYEAIAELEQEQKSRLKNKNNFK
ncbi:hypothetical protein CAQ69_08475 [Stutzerimonas stutzeri]|nr:hypothetical protein CAQ69_08475 [Stutzerimonas stutzeri]